jgi:hypothetical protein
MCAIEPLTTDVLLAAVSQDENEDLLRPIDTLLDEELLLEYCHNLLVIDNERDVWVPSHLSVIEYFENHLWSQKEANAVVSCTCLLLLNNTPLYDRESEWQQLNSDYDSGGSYRFGDYRGSLYWKKIKNQDDPLCTKSFGPVSFYVRHHWVFHVRKYRTIVSCFIATRIQWRSMREMKLECSPMEHLESFSLPKPYLKHFFFKAILTIWLLKETVTNNIGLGIFIKISRPPSTNFQFAASTDHSGVG